KIDKRRQ
ncbi:hypothetical protein ECN1_0310, partial [Escherichia coli N1]